MTDFAYSRGNVLARLLGLPLLLAANAIGAASDNIRSNFSVVREEFVPAVRYVMTGDPDTTVVGHTGSKVSAFGDRVRTVFETHAQDRLIALGLLLLMPLLALYMLFCILKDEEYFQGLYDGIVQCGRAVVTGDRVLD